MSGGLAMETDAARFDAVTASPIGRIGIRLQCDCIAELAILADSVEPRRSRHGLIDAALHQLACYFDDPAFPFDLPLLPQGTAFQQRVRSALRQIPVGQVLTYGELAQQLGSGPRAVGGACRRNPLPILAPCHRVVAANGKGGYAGATSGPWLAIKARLLQHEGVCWPPAAPSSDMTHV
jgi:methylated-DNA-[protein]-cysteine S-methyltransferase